METLSSSKDNFSKRPDILENLELSKEDMEILETIKKELNK